MIMTTTFINFSRSILSAFGAVLADAVYTTSLKNIYSKAVKKVTNPVILQDLQKFSLSQLTSSTALLKTLHPETEHFVKTQIMNAIRNVFYMTIGFSAITFLLHSLLPMKDYRKTSRNHKNNLMKKKQKKVIHQLLMYLNQKKLKKMR